MTIYTGTLRMDCPDNQTNLAIKGIITIKAMSQISSFVNKTTDFDKYSVRADLLDVA